MADQNAIAVEEHANKHDIQYHEGADNISEAGHHDLAQTKSAVSTLGGIGGFEINGDDLPPGYFKSKFFIGSMAAICVSLWGGVSAFVSPRNKF